jgi:hypothetical protein
MGDNNYCVAYVLPLPFPLHLPPSLSSSPLPILAVIQITLTTLLSLSLCSSIVQECGAESLRIYNSTRLDVSRHCKKSNDQEGAVIKQQNAESESVSCWVNELLNVCDSQRTMYEVTMCSMPRQSCDSIKSEQLMWEGRGQCSTGVWLVLRNSGALSSVKLLFFVPICIVYLQVSFIFSGPGTTPT